MPAKPAAAVVGELNWQKNSKREWSVVPHESELTCRRALWDAAPWKRSRRTVRLADGNQVITIDGTVFAPIILITALLALLLLLPVPTLADARQVFTIDDTVSAPTFTTAGAEAGLMFDMDLLFKTTTIHTPGNPSREKWGWHWFLEPLFNARLRDLGASAHGALPLAMRLGGGHQCCTLYNVTGKLQLPLPTAPYYCSVEHPGPASIMQPYIWDAILASLHQANLSLVFGITGGYGRAATNGTRGNRWDPAVSGFDELLNYTYENAVGREVAWGWELSNEPGHSKFENASSWKKDGASKVSAEMLAEDVLELSAMVHAAAGAAKAAHPTANILTPIVAGPDLSCDRTEKEIDEKLAYVTNFTNIATPMLDAVSMHYYSVSSRDKNASKELRDPANLDRFGAFFDAVTAHTPAGWRAGDGQIWCGETASLQNGGGAGISDAWQSTTWLYDQLGQSGEHGVSLQLRECLICSRYAYLNVTTAAPLPDFFTAALWHTHVSSRVLAVDPPHLGRTLRGYARCTRVGAGSPGGAVTLVVINMGTAAAEVSVRLVSGTSDGVATEQRVYNLAAADGTHSSSVALLNGQALALINEGLPEFRPRTESAGTIVSIAPLGVALIDVDADAPACR